MVSWSASPLQILLHRLTLLFLLHLLRLRIQLQAFLESSSLYPSSLETYSASSLEINQLTLQQILQPTARQTLQWTHLQKRAQRAEASSPSQVFLASRSSLMASSYWVEEIHWLRLQGLHLVRLLTLLLLKVTLLGASCPSLVYLSWTPSLEVSSEASSLAAPLQK